MSKDTFIKADHVSKKYCKSLKRSIMYGMTDISRNLAGLSSKSDILRKKEFWAIDDVSFELKKGETLGIIGENGSGKTTLLKMLNGIFWPDKGRITISGRVGALIAVGAGFHPLMTGRENIYVNGAIIGLSKKEIDRKFDEIVDFAEIGSFLDSPVKYYSSGMYVRLGFAIAVHCDPEILLVDEILAVGDMRFQQRCYSKFGELMNQGVSIILVSHQMLNIQKVCKNTMLLSQGKVVKYGESGEVISEYMRLSNSSNRFIDETDKAIKNISSHGVSLKYLILRNQKGEETGNFVNGDDIIAEFAFDTKKTIKNVSFHFSLGSNEYTYNGYSTFYDNIKVGELGNNTRIRIILKNVILSSGIYKIGIGVWDERYMGCYFWDYESIGEISIKSKKKIQGNFEFQHEWNINQNSGK